MGIIMSADPTQGLAPDPLTLDTQELLSLALDAQLVGYTKVAQDLSALACRLRETRGGSRIRAIARAILARANDPRQGFDTLLDPFDLSE